MNTDDDNSDVSISRRAAVTGGFGMLALLAAGPTMSNALPMKSGASNLVFPKVDLTTAAGSAETMARIAGNLNPAATKHGWYRGRIMGVSPDGPVRDLLGIKGLSSQRLQPLADRPGWKLMQKEVGIFFDLESGEVVDQWDNPYTSETVDILHIANPSVSRTIEPVIRDARFYEDPEGEIEEGIPFLLPWQRAGDRIFVEDHRHLWVKNPLDPMVWKRETSGAMIQVSDMMSFNVRASDLADPTLMSLESWGSWVHVRPWQPWMLMGDAPGHCLYNCFTGSADTLDDIPRDIVQVVRERHPDFLSPPDKMGKPEPSLVRFMRERKPAPPRSEQPMQGTPKDES